jgi:hypothetical protein
MNEEEEFTRVNDSCFISNVGVNKIVRTAYKRSANMTKFLVVVTEINKSN